ncbi:hypothetical protein [Geodermatophilus sp. SYSU D00766]
MPLAPRPLAAAVLAAVTVPLLVAAPAAAEDPAAGDTVVGELVRGYADPAPAGVAAAVHDDGALLTWVRSDSGEAVRVPAEDVEGVAAGSTLEVTLGEPVADEAAADGLEPALDVLAAEVVSAPPGPVTAPATGTVNHRVTVVMLQPAGAVRDATTLAQVRAVVDGPVADFWAEQTDGAVRFGTVAGFDWPAQPSALDCSDPFALWEEAATRAGWAGQPDEHLLVYVPAGSPGCAYGLGTVGGDGLGGLAYVQAAATSVVAHEFGHNLGLGHASHLRCPGSVDAGSCSVRPYHDLYDVMGVSWEQVGSLGAPHAALLGVLPPAVAPVLTSGAPATEFSLAPVGARTGTRAVALADDDGDVYWLEYRTAAGRDGWLGTAANRPGLETGVLLRLAGGAEDVDTSYLLDGTPPEDGSLSDGTRTALPVGQPVTIAGGHFRITVGSLTAGAATVSVVPVRDSPISRAWVASGGADGPLGAPSSDERCDLPGGGCTQRFAGGTLYWSAGTGVHRLRGAILSRYEALGGPASLGYPTSDDTPDRVAGVWYATFQRGDVVWSQATGAHDVRGAILQRWIATGASGGGLGLPVSGDTAIPGGYVVHFQRGSVWWSPATGAHDVRGAINEKYRATGGPSYMGFPVRDDSPDRVPGVWYSNFQQGDIVWSAGTGAQVVRGAILQRWIATGASGGGLGLPTSSDAAIPGGYVVHFQRGSVWWSPSTGAHDVRGAINEKYRATGGPSYMGFPVRDDSPDRVPGVWYSNFQQGDIVWSAGTGAQVVRGAILQRFVATGGAGGLLGLPVTSDAVAPGGAGYLVAFQRGTVYWSPATGARHVLDAHDTAYRAEGLTASWLGYPVGDTTAVSGGGRRTDFRYGTIRTDAGGRVTVTRTS